MEKLGRTVVPIPYEPTTDANSQRRIGNPTHCKRFGTAPPVGDQTKCPLIEMPRVPRRDCNQFKRSRRGLRSVAFHQGIWALGTYCAPPGFPGRTPSRFANNPLTTSACS